MGRAICFLATGVADDLRLDRSIGAPRVVVLYLSGAEQEELEAVRAALQADLGEQWGSCVGRRGNAPFWQGLWGPKSLLIHGPLKRHIEKLLEHCGCRGARAPNV